VSNTLQLAGWIVAIGAIAAAAAARYRMASLTEAVARTCHELRGPLTAVRLALALAARGGQLVDVRLRAIELELGRATLALDDLTDASQGPAPRGRAERIDLMQLLTESAEACRGLATAHGARVRLVPSRDRPIVRGERLRLAQAIGNLIANAIEHGGGLIDVGCRVAATRVLVEVRDDGPGLPSPVAMLMRRRTRPWRRPRPARGRRGHGLAIASAVAAAHGGRLISAPSDRGARLVLELPRPEEALQPRSVSGEAISA
jgi:signal transduction histidine kinase